MVAAVRRNAQVFVLLLLGAGMLHISLFTDLYLRYVKSALQPLLIASGVVLVALATVAAYKDGFVFRGNENPSSEEEKDAHAVAERSEDGSHGHSHAPRVSYLLFLPALALLLYLPPALGSFTAGRENENVAVENKSPQGDGKGGDTSLFPALPKSSQPVPLTVTEFIMRAQQDKGKTLEGRSVRITGFVTPGRSGEPWDLTRIIIACCAADSQSMKVRIEGTPTPPADSWVTVTGTWQQPAKGEKPRKPTLELTNLKRIPEPKNPYADTPPKEQRD